MSIVGFRFCVMPYQATKLPFWATKAYNRQFKLLRDLLLNFCTRILSHLRAPPAPWFTQSGTHYCGSDWKHGTC